MALKVELRPHERIIIGACVITNTDQRAKLLIEGDRIPILREKDILTPETADTPAKLIYLAVQLMYLAPDPMAHHPTYFSLIKELLGAAPSSWPFIEAINNYILNGDLYHALKEARKLIAHEAKLLDDARAKAIEDAHRKAEIYARAAGVTLGTPLNISEHGAPGPVPYRKMAAAMADSAPVAPGEETLRVSVSVSYEIKPKAP